MATLRVGFRLIIFGFLTTQIAWDVYSAGALLPGLSETESLTQPTVPATVASITLQSFSGCDWYTAAMALHPHFSSRSVQALDVVALRAAHRRGDDKRVSVTVLESVESTNTWVKDRFSSGQPTKDGNGRCVVFAEDQRAGRGRRGNSWQMRPCDDIVFSLGYPMPSGLRLEGLSLVTGVALAEALEALGMTRIGAKWPNDLVVGHRKLAGILIEISTRASGGFDIVAGVGINFSPTNHDSRIGAVEIMDVPRTRQALAEVLSVTVLDAFDEFSQTGFESFIDRFEKFDVLTGKPVIAASTQSSDQQISGVAAGVTPYGALRVRLDDGTLTEVHAGDVTLASHYSRSDSGAAAT